MSMLILSEGSEMGVAFSSSSAYLRKSPHDSSTPNAGLSGPSGTVADFVRSKNQTT
jgi:hypothetical protein